MREHNGPGDNNYNRTQKNAKKGRSEHNIFSSQCHHNTHRHILYNVPNAYLPTLIHIHMYNSSARCFHVTLHGFLFPPTALPWTLNNFVRLTLMWRFYEKNNPIERERIDGFSFYSDEYIIIIIIISSLLPLGAPSASRHSRTILYICMLDEINITLVPICVQSDSPSMLTPIFFLSYNEIIQILIFNILT